MILCVMALCAAGTGCRAVPVGFVIALVRDGIQELDMRGKEATLINRHPVVADDLLGRRLDSLRDVRTGERFLRYPIANLLGRQEFYFLRISETNRVNHVSRWLSWSDGLEDTLKRRSIGKKVLGRPLGEAQRIAGLTDPIFLLASGNSAERMAVFDVTNFTHLRPRLLTLHLDKNGICRGITFYGVASGNDLRSTGRTARAGLPRAEPATDRRSGQLSRALGVLP